MATIFDVINEVGETQPRIKPKVTGKYVTGGGIATDKVADALKKFKSGYDDPKKKLGNKMTDLKTSITREITSIASDNDAISKANYIADLKNKELEGKLVTQGMSIKDQKEKITGLQRYIKKKEELENPALKSQDNSRDIPEEGIGRTTILKPLTLAGRISRR